MQIVRKLCSVRKVVTRYLCFMLCTLSAMQLLMTAKQFSVSCRIYGRAAKFADFTEFCEIHY